MPAILAQLFFVDSPADTAGCFGWRPAEQSPDQTEGSSDHRKQGRDIRMMMFLQQKNPLGQTSCF